MSASPFVRVNRAKLHAFIEHWADVIDGAPVPDDDEVRHALSLINEVAADVIMDALGTRDEYTSKNMAEALWRSAGVAGLIGMAIADSSGEFLEHKVYGENGRAAS